MHLTISSIFTAGLFNSLLILMFCIYFKQDRTMSKIGPNCMMVILFAIMLRLLVPFEFSYTKSIWINEILTPLRMLLIYPVLLNPIKITIWHIIVVFWVISVMWIMLYKLYSYRKIIRYVSILSRLDWDVVLIEYDLKVEQFEGLQHISFALSNEFKFPCLIGVKHPYIILPNITYKKEQLFYIIQHELMHIYNKDLIWKILIDLLCTIFWWNPVILYLKQEVYELIEIRNDMAIVAGVSVEEKKAYMECLKDTALQMVGKDVAFGVSFNRSGIKTLTRRLKLILEEKRPSRFHQVVFYFLTVVFLVISSLVIIEPYSLPDTDENVVELTPENMYLVDNGDQYDVYVFGHYAMSIEKNERELFQNIKVYKSNNEVQEIMH